MWPFKNILEYFRNRRIQQSQAIIEQFLAHGSIPIPPGGRASKEEPSSVNAAMLNFLSQLDGLQPELPFDLVEFLVRTAPLQPDMHHAQTNLVNLANSGHSLMIDAKSDSVTERALDRLNEKAATLYPLGAGIDGLVNAYLEQIFITGAISSEDVVNAQGDGVEKVALVPTERIRFRLEGDNYLPYQKLRSDGTLIPLAGETYRYSALSRMQASPYAIPPMAAAINSVTDQRDMLKNFKFMLKKFGLLGLVAYSLTPPPRKGSETDSEYQDRAQKHLSEVTNKLKDNFLLGLLVKYNDQTLEHHNITGDARGAGEMWNMNREHLASGMGMDPLVMGMPGKSTESFANVTYLFLIRMANNIRRLVKRRMERTYKLDLMLGGIEVDGVFFKFKDNPARKPLDEAQAEMNRVTFTIKKAQVGMIDPDLAAQELGYDGWFDPDLLFNTDEQGGEGIGLSVFSKQCSVFSKQCSVSSDRLRIFNYDSELGRYRFVRPHLRLNTEHRTLNTELASEEAVRKTLKKFADKYLEKITPFLGESTAEALEVLKAFLRRSSAADFPTAEAFATRAYALLSEIYVDAFRSKAAQDAIKEAVKETYEFYRLEDRAAFAKAPAVAFTMDLTDRRTLRFMRELDRFYLSKWITNAPTERSLRAFLEEEYLTKGAGLFGRANSDNIETFIALATDRLEALTEFEARRIIDTGVQRMRNWANIRQLDQAGIKVARIVNPSPEAEICIFMVNEIKFIPMQQARESVDEMSGLTPEAFANRLTQITPDLIAIMGVESATRQGFGYPPYHPNCKTRVVATERTGLSREQLSHSHIAIDWLAGVCVN